MSVSKSAGATGAEGPGAGAAAGAAARLAGAGVGREQAALAHLVADLDDDLADYAVLGRGHVERRLVAFKGQKGLLLADRLPRSDKNLDDRNILEVADVGKPDFLGHDPVLPFRG